MHGTDGGPQQLHPKHIERLAAHVNLAHVHHALQAEQRTRRGRGHPVLPGTRLCDYPRLAHPAGQQRLADDVVDLVTAGMGQIFTLEQYPYAEMVRQTRTLGDGGGPTAIVTQDTAVLGDEGRIRPGLAKRRLEFDTGRHQCLGDIAAPELTKAPVGTWFSHERWQRWLGNHVTLSPWVRCNPSPVGSASDLPTGRPPSRTGNRWRRGRTWAGAPRPSRDRRRWRPWRPG